MERITFYGARAFLLPINKMNDYKIVHVSPNVSENVMSLRIQWAGTDTRMYEVVRTKLTKYSTTNNPNSY